MGTFERTELHSTFTLQHHGVNPNMDIVHIDLIAGMSGDACNAVAGMPGTAFVQCGQAKQKVADHGYWRSIYITDVHVEALTQRTIHNRWTHKHHWDCTVVVLYHAIVLHIPEGKSIADAGKLPLDFSSTKLREELRAHSGR